MYKRILVALSGSDYTPASIETAVHLAQRHDAQITGVTIIDPKRGDPRGAGIGGSSTAHAASEDIRERTQHNEAEAVDMFVDACAKSDVAYSVDRSSGDILDKMERLRYFHDLLIVGLRGLFEYGVFRDPHDEVSRLLHRGIRPLLATAKEYKPVKRVLIAYHGSRAGASTIERFAMLNAFDVEHVKILTVRKDVERAQEDLAPAVDYLEAWGYTVETEIKDGSPAPTLLEESEAWKADLLVMGSSGRFSIRQLLLGNTISQCLRDTTVPIFTGK